MTLARCAGPGRGRGGGEGQGGELECLKDVRGRLRSGDMRLERQAGRRPRRALRLAQGGWHSSPEQRRALQGLD